MFNPFYFRGEAGEELRTLMDNVTVPTFTNALNASAFEEIYLRRSYRAHGCSGA